MDRPQLQRPFNEKNMGSEARNIQPKRCQPLSRPYLCDCIHGGLASAKKRTRCPRTEQYPRLALERSGSVASNAFLVVIRTYRPNERKMNVGPTVKMTRTVSFPTPLPYIATRRIIFTCDTVAECGQANLSSTFRVRRNSPCARRRWIYAFRVPEPACPRRKNLQHLEFILCS